MARKRAGGSLRKPRAAARRTTRTHRAASTNGRRRAPAATAGAGSQDIDALAASLVSNVQALAEAVKNQAAEVKELRDRLDGVRRSLG